MIYNSFILQFYYSIDEIQEMLSSNRIWKQRLINIGVVNLSKQALDWGFSGVMFRGSGLFWDLRLIEPYDIIIYLIFLYQ